MKSVALLLIFMTFHVLTNGHLRPSIQSFSKEVTAKSPEHDLIYAAPSDIGSYFYAFCIKVQNAVDCEVNEETPVANGISSKKTCPVQLRNGDEKMLKPLSDHKVLLTSHIANKDLEITLIRMDDCSIKKLSLKDVSSFQVYTNEKNFDVLYTDTNSTGNCNRHICRKSFKSDNEYESQNPVMFLNRTNHQSPSKKWEPLLLSSPVSYYREEMANSTNVLYKVDAHGNSTVMMKNNLPFLTSNFHQELGICYLTNPTNLTCKKYESDSKIAVNFNLSSSVFSIVKNSYSSLHNLKGNKLMLLIVDLVLEQGDLRVLNFNPVILRPDGHYSYPLQIEFEDLDFGCSKILKKAMSFEKLAIEPSIGATEEDREICFQFICSNYDYETVKLKFSTKCVPKGYISSSSRVLGSFYLLISVIWVISLW